MKFSDKLFDNFTLANQHSLLGKKAVEELLQFFKQLCNTQETYAKNLETLSNFQFLLLRGSTFEACQSLKQDLLKNSKELRVFIDNLQQDLIKPLQQVSSSIQESSKSLFSESSKVQKLKDHYLEKLSRLKDKFFKSCSECEKITNFLEQPQSQAQREKYLQKLQKHKNQLDIDLKQYEDHINSWEDFMSNYQPLVLPILASYERVELNRLMGIKDQLRKYVVYEASYIRSMQYEIDGLAKNMEEIHVEADLIDFCPQTLPWTKPEFEPYRGSHPSFKAINPNGLSIPIPLPVQEAKWSEIVFQGSIEEMYKTEIDIITLKATQGHELISEDFIQFNSLIKDSLGRRAWVWSMSLKKTDPLLSDKGYIHLGELMLSVLNEVKSI
jgi:hypothetical protein